MEGTAWRHSTQLLRLSRWAPLRPSRCARKCLRGPLPVCAPYSLPNAAAGGVVTRCSLQVSLPVLAHGCREMRSEVHQVACTLSHKGALDVGSMLPKAPITSALVRNTRTHKGRKNNEPRGVHPFVNSNVLRTAAHPRAALPSHNVQSSLPSPTT